MPLQAKQNPSRWTSVATVAEEPRMMEGYHRNFSDQRKMLLFEITFFRAIVVLYYRLLFGLYHIYVLNKYIMREKKIKKISF